MAKKKTKEQLFAEFIYEYGWRDGAFKRVNDILDEETLITTRAALALKQYKEMGGRRPSDIDKAREEWEKAGKPSEGIRGYKFKESGEYNVMETFDATFFPGEQPKKKRSSDAGR
jgi:hypothetical protein